VFCFCVRLRQVDSEDSREEYGLGDHDRHGGSGQLARGSPSGMLDDDDDNL
jgi:hypothetical protein